MSDVKFDHDLAMQGLGCLHKDAPLIKAAEHYFYEVSKPQIEALQTRVKELEAALLNIRKEGDRFTNEAVMDWDAVQDIAWHALQDGGRKGEG